MKARPSALSGFPKEQHHLPIPVSPLQTSYSSCRTKYRKHFVEQHVAEVIHG